MTVSEQSASVLLADRLPGGSSTVSQLERSMTVSEQSASVLPATPLTSPYVGQTLRNSVAISFAIR